MVQGPPAGPEKPAAHSHSDTEELPNEEAEPDGHVKHVAIDVAPSVPENFPAPQLLHEALPMTPLYVPVAQLVQGPPSGPDEPGVHTQNVNIMLPDTEVERVGHAWQVASDMAPTLVEYDPVPQSLHAALPVTSLYFPATHSVQLPPFGPFEPALQLHAVKDELPAAASEFAGHAEHVSSVVCPVPVEYLPAPQSAQESDPCADLYFPATH